MSCPRCKSEGYNCPPEYWTCSECGGILFIDENAYVHCDKCGNEAYLLQMSLMCNSGRHGYELCSSNAYIGAIGAASHKMLGDDDRVAMSFMYKILQSL